MSGILTARQTDVLSFIRACIALNGLPPTRAEICTHFGFTSYNAAQQHLRAIEAKGWISLKAGASRGIVVSKEALGGGAVQVADDLAALHARTVVGVLQELDRCCGYCEYEEADGTLIRHCATCCRRIVAALGLLRRKMTKGLLAISEKRRKPVQRARRYPPTYRGGTLGT